MTRAGLAVMLLAVALAAADSARAAEREHEVRSGESAAAIAKRYYGDHELAGMLLRYNGRDGTVIRPGERLRVPYCEVHVVKSGDSLSVLARRYLGRPSAYRAVARLNGMAPDSPLRVGQSIVMPVVFSHALRRGETLGALADLNYGDHELGDMLQEFNGIEDPRRLSVGQTVLIPVVGLRLRDESPPEVMERTVADRPGSEEPVSPPEPRFEAELTTARRDFERGDYDGARERLEAMRKVVGETGTEMDRAEFARLLAFVYIAFDRTDDACVALRVAGSADPLSGLDPDLISPKILDSLAACDGV
jgi:LysM repeat protein